MFAFRFYWRPAIQFKASLIPDKGANGKEESYKLVCENRLSATKGTEKASG